MELRDTIIEILDNGKNYEFSHNYEKLKLSLNLNKEDYNTIDVWFMGVINSLYYNPNHVALALVGSQGNGKTYFFENMFPKEMSSLYSDVLVPSLYTCLVTNIEFTKNLLSIIKEDNFIIYEENARALIHPATDKRLTSYCTTSNHWPYHKRKDVIDIAFNGLDRYIFDSIDKLELWREIFFKFKNETL